MERRAKGSTVPLAWTSSSENSQQVLLLHARPYSQGSAHPVKERKCESPSSSPVSADSSEFIVLGRFKA